jgi:hypothetical protein
MLIVNFIPPLSLDNLNLPYRAIRHDSIYACCFAAIKVQIPQIAKPYTASASDNGWLLEIINIDSIELSNGSEGYFTKVSSPISHDAFSDNLKLRKFILTSYFMEKRVANYPNDFHSGLKRFLKYQGYEFI